MVELANEVDVDPWFNMPHLASDDYIRQFAISVRDNIEFDRYIYVEYSNEVWNYGFYQAQWVEQQGMAMWPDSTVSNLEKRLNWFGMRTAQMCDIWEDVFGELSHQVRCVVGTQAANTWIGEKMLDCTLWAEAPCHQHNVDAVAIAPYFGQHIGQPSYQAQVENWTNDADGGLNRLFAEIEHGNHLPQASFDKTTLQDAMDNVSDYADVAAARAIDLVAYEGGQHLVGVGGVLWSNSITELFGQANRDPRMAQLYAAYYDHWLQEAGNLHVLYATVGMYSQWGNWGAQEFADVPGAPKRAAADEFIADNPCDWDACNPPDAIPTAVGLNEVVAADSAEFPLYLLLVLTALTIVMPFRKRRAL